jgi:dolichyl-diphosphooligosaccharide--protein glycosyltransferase
MAASGYRQRIGGALAGFFGRFASVRVSVKTRTVLEASILGLVVVLAILFRIMPLRFGEYFSSEADTTFQYRMTEYVVKNGYSAWFSWHDDLSWYPWGRDISHSAFPGVPFSAAFVYSFLTFLGINVSVLSVCLYFPVLMASLTCIAIYFLGRKMGGGLVGLFGAFFMAASSAYLSRTTFGFFDDETIGIFGLVIMSLFFLLSIEEGKPLAQRLLYAVVAGLALGYVNASWGASRYAIGILAVFVFASLLVKLYNRRYLVSFILTVGIGYLIAINVPKLGFPFLTSLDNIAVLGFVGFLLIYEAIRGRLSTGRLLVAVGLMFVAMFGGLLVLESMGMISPIAGKFIRVLFPTSATDSPLIQSVAEHKSTTWGTFFDDFGLTIGLAMLGTYFAIRKVEESRFFGLLFFLTSVYFAGSLIRLVLVLAVPLSLMAAYGMKELLTPFATIAMQKAAERRPRRRRAVFGIGREFGALFTILILVATLPAIWGAAQQAESPATIAVSVPVSIGGAYPQDWLQALDWMSDNLPSDAIVVSWWDYGYWIEGWANRTTLADGATINTTQIAEIGKIMMLNETQSIEILKKFNATHILVYTTFNPSNTQQQWPFGDNAKWVWMAKIGGLNDTDYYQGGSYTDKFYQSTLYRLMTVDSTATHFQLVYASEYEWVLVYKIIY